jgi:cytoskeletal protein RodZ
MDQPEEKPQTPKPLGLLAADAVAIGRRLAEARESRRLSVTDVARKVKIREHFVQAIEKGDWSSLPQGLHGRGLVRSYAKELGVGIPELDPSAHLSPSNAKVERAEQVLAEEVVRTQTIRTYPSSDGPTRSPGMMSATARRSAVGDKGVAKPAATRESALQRNPAPPAQKIQRSEIAQRGGFGDSDDETPLDVVTPDIAAVLGLDPREVVPEPKIQDDVPDHLEDPKSVPQVRVDDVLGFGVVDSSEHHGHHEDHDADTLPGFREPSPSVVEAAQAPAIDEMMASVAMPKAAVSQDPLAAAQQTVVTHEPEQPVSGIHSYVEQIARTQPTPSAHGGAYGDVRSDEADASPSRARRSNRWRSVLVLGMTAAAMVAFGVFYLVPLSQHREPLRIEDMGQDPVSGVDPLIESTDTMSSGVDVETVVAPSDSQASDAKDLPQEAAPPDAAETTQAPTPPEAQVATSEQDVQPAEVAPTPIPQDSAATVAPSPAPNVLGAGSALAVLHVKSPVAVQIRAGGQVLVQGTQSPGPLSFRFSDKAEIIIDDGSKADLEFADWAHGPLGHPGRKRRIILNSAAF